ncbi:hypothetical protein N1851_014101 [Merluccius polli]|uniref:Uncharacterized protein n=1 Tax=Merluccius polli TaxID=89951 RepID=A0AA47MUV8_MERPO|nr:hypothetical protein N1851_014101 [Merluccius polli]
MDSNAKELSALLDTFGLLQHVKGPTHTRGHTLDLVISNISSVDVKDSALSDNFCVFFDLQIIPNVHYVTNCESVDELLDKFNWKISNVMDAVAPIKTKTTLTQKENTMEEHYDGKQSVSGEKNKLQIHHDLYKISLCNFNYELLKARQRHFSEIINKNINNTRTLFAMVDKLTNPPKQIAPELLSTAKCNEFACFFSEKIQSIRSARQKCAKIHV